MSNENHMAWPMSPERQISVLINAHNLIAAKKTKWLNVPLWSFVSRLTGHGSGYSIEICRAMGWDANADASKSVLRPSTRITVEKFLIQSTQSFPDGAPQREEYDGDEPFLRDCKKYDEEWRSKYICGNGTCSNRDCPQHFPNH